ncbi:Phage Tail Protein X [compost metagenome]
MIVYALQHDTVDAMCHRAFGFTAGLVEMTLELNPGLADLGPVLPEGTEVQLPQVQVQPAAAPSVKLW